IVSAMKFTRNYSTRSIASESKQLDGLRLRWSTLRFSSATNSSLYQRVWEEMFLNLAHGVARQAIDRDELAGDFERSELRAALGFECSGVERIACHDEGYGNFAADAVGNADY